MESLLSDYESRLEHQEAVNNDLTLRICHLDTQADNRKLHIQQLEEENQKKQNTIQDLNRLIASLAESQESLQTSNQYLQNQLEQMDERLHVQYELQEENQRLQSQIRQLEQEREHQREQHVESLELQIKRESEKQLIIEELQSQLPEGNQVQELTAVAESLREKILHSETEFQFSESITFRRIEILEEENKQLRKQLKEKSFSDFSQMERQIHIVEAMQVRESTMRDKYVLREYLLGLQLTLSVFPILRFVGKGCNGIVMLCSVQGQSKQVALKMVVRYGPGDREKERNEIAILPDITRLHPNIIYSYTSFEAVPSGEMLQEIDESVRDLCYESPAVPHITTFFVLEYHETTLASRLGCLDLLDILKYSRQLASALVFLKEQRIAHLDIKCDNLMISSLGDLIVGDFGCSVKLNDAMEAPENAGGNSLHLAPEVIQAIREQKPPPCEKQYSWELGTIIFEMFTGNFPFDDYTGENLSQPNVLGLHFLFRDLVLQLLAPVNDRIQIETAQEKIFHIQRQGKLY